MAETNYDVHISYIDDDLKKVQTKTNMYIQKYGDMGVFHLFKELAQNSIDEYSDPLYNKAMKALGEKVGKKKIRVTYNQLIDEVVVEDDGRGIPEEDQSVEITCTKLQAGSKFYRDQGGVSSGEFGCGITVVNALSSRFTIATYRNDYYHKLVFENGEKVEDIRESTKKSGKKHGTIMSFICNQVYLGAGSKLPIDTCIDWMEMMSYLVEDGIEFDISIYDGKDLIKTQKISKKPFSDLIDKFIIDKSTIAFGPVNMSGDSTIVEKIKKSTLNKKGVAKEKEETVKKHVELEFAFAYDSDIMEYEYDSFCNFTKTDEGGIHVDGVEEALVKFLQTKAMDSMTDNQKEMYPVTRPDIKTGLKLVVNLATNAQVDFMGNAKNKIQSEALKPVVREIARNAIEEFFSKSPGKLADVIKIVRANAKARVDLQKMRTVTVKGKNSRFDDLMIENFIPCNNNKPGAYREIYWIEGKKSAAGAMVDGRDPMHQAIYAFRGQTLNPYKTTLARFMENVEWSNAYKVLRCGIGPTFDIRRLYYDKIIIGTDADIDGAGIASGMGSTVALYTPEIITAGKLYRCYPPLYRIDYKPKPYIGNKKELVEIYMDSVMKRFKLRIGTSYMFKDEMMRFLYDISDYRFIMKEMVQPFYKIPVALLETIAASLVIQGGVDTRGSEPALKPGVMENPRFIRDFMKMIQSRFPETVMNNGTISGIANGAKASIHINDRFVSKIEPILSIYEKYGFIIAVKDKELPDRLMTILEFCDYTSALTPNIMTRFKGLGECNADELWETFLNPENRLMVQLTMEDIERDMEIFRKLKSDKPLYAKQRAEMVEKYKIRYEDLDN